jgi:hypothetical protein
MKKFISTILSRRLYRVLSGFVLGLVFGLGWYFFIGCNTGTCGISSDPLNSALYWGIAGLVMFWPAEKKNPSQTQEQNQQDLL